MPRFALPRDEEDITSSGLLTDKTITAFLSRYEVGQWPQAILLATLHGVLCFEDVLGQETTALTELRSIIEEKICHVRFHAACEPQSKTCQMAALQGADSLMFKAKDQARVINIQRIPSKAANGIQIVNHSGMASCTFSHLDICSAEWSCWGSLDRAFILTGGVTAPVQQRMHQCTSLCAADPAMKRSAKMTSLQLTSKKLLKVRPSCILSYRFCVQLASQGRHY
jgi:hypothetical protein